MRESHFIEQNKKKWYSLEQLLTQKKKDPNKLSKLFIQITDDLAYARTFYPNRSVRVYLNGLAQSLFVNIYKNKKEKGNRFIFFWKEELPALVFHCRKQLLVSFFIFTLAVGIGVLSSIHEPDFCRVILGDRYIEMTQENIESGDPMAVYKSANELNMFLGITINNLRVDILTFVMGVFTSLGTIMILLFNGIMLGAFQYFFYEQGLFQESFLTIWVHGTVEITTIIIAGGAGIVLGQGLLFPGTYTRLQSFQISARKGFKLIIGILPLTIFAGFVEGFLTRYTELPDAIRAAFIGMCFIYVLFYFVWYPYRKAGRGFKINVKNVQLRPSKPFSLSLNTYKDNGQILIDTFQFLKKYIQQILLLSAITSLLGALLFVGSNWELLTQLGEVQVSYAIRELRFIFWEGHQLDQNWLIYVGFHALIMGSVGYVFLNFARSKQGEKGLSIISYIKRYIIFFILFSAVLDSVLFAKIQYGIYLYCLLGTTIFCLISHVYLNNGRLVHAFARGFNALKTQFARCMGLFLLFSFMGGLLLLLYATLVQQYIGYISQNLGIEGSIILFIVNLTLFLFFQALYIGALCIAYAILYFNLKEIADASHLKQRIDALTWDH